MCSGLGRPSRSSTSRVVQRPSLGSPRLIGPIHEEPIGSARLSQKGYLSDGIKMSLSVSGKHSHEARASEPFQHKFLTRPILRR
jgi:hypothetical protein